MCSICPVRVKVGFQESALGKPVVSCYCSLIMKVKAVADMRVSNQRSQVGVVVSPHCELHWHLERWLREQTSAVEFSSITELKQTGQLQKLDLVVLVSAHRHSFRQSEIDGLILNAPFLPLICINSEWEDGIARSGTILNGIVNVHWTTAISYLNRWRNGEVEFLLSRTDSQWESYGDATQWRRDTPSIAVTGSDQVAQMWIESLAQAGVEATEFATTQNANTVLIDWRDSIAALESRLNAIRSAKSGECDQQIIVLMHMPRQKLVARMKRLGASHVLKHPVSLRTIIGMVGESRAVSSNEAA